MQKINLKMEWQPIMIANVMYGVCSFAKLMKSITYHKGGYIMTIIF
jgi:hypothetical protein